MPPRLAIVVSHPTQYYGPWFRWLAAREQLPLRVFYLWDFGVSAQRDPKFEVPIRWDTDLLSGYEHEFVPNTAAHPGTHHFWGLRNPSLTRRLAAWQPQALLLFGYKWSSHLRTIVWARRNRVPLLFRGDSHFLGRTRPPFPQRFLLQSLFRQFAAFLPVGAANRDYFTVLGVPESRLFFAPHAVDHTLFDPTRTDHRSAARELRAQLALPADTKVVLFAGKLVPEKQPRELLAAFLALQPPNTALVFVGDGPDKAALIEIARQSTAQTHIHSAPPRPPSLPPSLTPSVPHSLSSPPLSSIYLLPFANQSEMPARYLLADLFVLPSRGHYETWGLAVNEAMHMGVPCLVSDRVGCQRDLVTPGETGWVFRHDDPADLRAQLTGALNALRDPTQATRIQSQVRQRISSYTYEQTTSGLQEALGNFGS